MKNINVTIIFGIRELSIERPLILLRLENEPKMKGGQAIDFYWYVYQKYTE